MMYAKSEAEDILDHCFGTIQATTRYIFTIVPR